MFKRIEFYDDYRRYLLDFHEERKKKNSLEYSFRVFCPSSGIKSLSLLKEVIQGKRNLTIKTMPAFIKGLCLSTVDAEYFTLLADSAVHMLGPSPCNLLAVTGAQASFVFGAAGIFAELG